MKPSISAIVQQYHGDKTRLLDIFWDIQNELHYIPEQALTTLSTELKLSVPELKDTLTFYHFFHDVPAGETKIYLDTSAIAEINGLSDTIQAFETALNCSLGQVDPTGKFGLFGTSCIGMSDQAPAALVDGVPVNRLNPEKVFALIEDLRAGRRPVAHVENNVYLKGGVLLADTVTGKSLEALKTLPPAKIIDEIKQSGIRGRGGAGFATGVKWELCTAQRNQTRYVVCNADEGEPGTFKDRYLLTEMAHLVFEGMIIGARAIGARQGIVYLRAEYRYLRPQLEAVLEKMRQQRRLGNNIIGLQGFDFDIRIQVGAGAYVVGEETALLESLEGRRGEPRIRPPFPVEEGFLQCPTIVNNVETFATVARIVQHGAQWYRGFGTPQSPGTKLLSVSGDCARQGIYEIEWGLTIGDFLNMVGAQEPLAVQVGGPSGICINAADVNRTLSFEDLPTGGSMMVFSKQRDILQIIRNFVRFFVDESCGCCLPCRAGNIVLNEQMDFILSGEAAMIDLERIEAWSKTIALSSRCGLGQTCTHPLLTSMKSFPALYRSKVTRHESLYRPFRVDAKTMAYEQVVKQHAQTGKAKH